MWDLNNSKQFQIYLSIKYITNDIKCVLEPQNIYNSHKLKKKLYHVRHRHIVVQFPVIIKKVNIILELED